MTDAAAWVIRRRRLASTVLALLLSAVVGFIVGRAGRKTASDALPVPAQAAVETQDVERGRGPPNPPWLITPIVERPIFGLRVDFLFRLPPSGERGPAADESRVAYVDGLRAKSAGRWWRIQRSHVAYGKHTSEISYTHLNSKPQIVGTIEYICQPHPHYDSVSDQLRSQLLEQLEGARPLEFRELVRPVVEHGDLRLVRPLIDVTRAHSRDSQIVRSALTAFMHLRSVDAIPLAIDLIEESDDPSVVRLARMVDHWLEPYGPPRSLKLEEAAQMRSRFARREASMRERLGQ